MITIIEDILEDLAWATYYIHWENESICEKPAFMLFDKFSLASKNKKWTLRMSDITSWEFDNPKDAEIALSKFFLTAKEDKGGYLYKKQNGKLKVFAKKPKREYDEITFASHSSY